MIKSIKCACLLFKFLQGLHARTCFDNLFPNSVSTLRCPRQRQRWYSPGSRSGLRGRLPQIQKFRCKTSMCISTDWQVQTMCAGRFCPFRRSTFTGALCSFFGTICVFPGKHGISGNAGPLTGARLSRHVHPRGGRGTFCMFLKCWQAWVEMRGGFGYH